MCIDILTYERLPYTGQNDNHDECGYLKYKTCNKLMYLIMYFYLFLQYWMTSYK